MSRVLGAALVALTLTGCGAFLPRFSDDVQAALAHDDMRRLETERFIIYYAAHRRAEIDRFLVRATRCADALRDAALVHDGPWRDKMVVVMPDVAFNNAFVVPELAGYEHISVVPTVATLDFTTEFGLVPDPGAIACHELTHYVHVEQVDGLWKHLDRIFGHIYSPQSIFDFWFLEGLATHYEAALQPGMGRPTWPIFTGMFAAAYAGKRMVGGDLSDQARLAPVGHHYLVGTMLVRFLTEKLGEPAAWKTIADQASALTGLFTPLAFRAGFGSSLGDLIDQFEAWHAKTFPVRARPPGQRALVELGTDARYARGRDGTEAWVSSDVDRPVTLTVRDPDGRVLASIGLVDIVPPRTLVIADPLMISGLSITADGREVWLTAIDLDATRQVTRLLRWRRGDTQLTEVARELGPGATIDPTGAIYYHAVVDGDRWRLAAFDVRTRQRTPLLDMAPGTYALAAQVSPDGARLAVNVWDGRAFAIWVIDAVTGHKLRELHGAGIEPVWDASFTDDGRAMYLGVVDARFQVFIEGAPVSDAPYAVLNARAAHGAIRLLNRDGWRWTVDELALPGAPSVAPPSSSDPPATMPETPAKLAAWTRSAEPPRSFDEPYRAWERLFVPTLRAPTALRIANGVPHLGIQLGGGDRLDLQRWLIAAYGQYDESLSKRVHWGADFQYLNHMLAPWTILATAGFIDWVDSVERDAGTIADERRSRDVTLAISRTWRNALTASLTGVYADDDEALLASPRRHLGGPVLAVDWLSSESTPYTGIRRALLARARVGYFPRAASTFAGDIYDTRGELGAVVPLPFGARHTFAIVARGRALLARDDSRLLQLGGDAGIATLWDHSNKPAMTYDDTAFPPNLRFIEPLRGYEDYGIATDRTAVADLSWRYPLIIDRGVAATLWLLPSSFLRQLDLELFAAAALDRAVDLHAAVGGTITANFTLIRIPLTLGYQLARRVRDDRALTQLLGLSLPLPY